MNDTPGAPPAGVESVSTTLREHGLLAPVWHTVVLILFLFAYSAAGYYTSRRFVHVGVGGAAPAPVRLLPTYILTLVFEWVLFFYVFWAERRYTGAKLRERIGGRWANAMDVWRDIGLAFGLWIVIFIISGISHVVFRPKGAEVVQKLLPSVWWQLFPWILISISAGFCEEYVFRGYLMEQFRRLTGAAWLAIVIQALIFGISHGYQGLALMFSIVLLGLAFGIAAYSLKSLRVNMIAHGWTDFFSGAAIYLLRVLHRLPGM